VSGGIVAGFAAFKHHLSYLPFSGPLPKPLVQQLIALRLAELGRSRRR
jgi:hypothetical protein